MFDSGTDFKPGPGTLLLMGILLVILFFFPWVGLIVGGEEFSGGKDTSTLKLWKASGWQLLRGDYSLSEKLKYHAPATNKKPPKAKPQFILGLIAPALLLLITGLSLTGKLPSRIVGMSILVPAILGIIVVVMAFSVDYAGDWLEEEKASVVVRDDPTTEESRQNEGGPGMGTGGSSVGTYTKEQWEAHEEFTRSLCRTKPTFLVWTSLVLYSILGLCGLVNLKAP